MYILYPGNVQKVPYRTYRRHQIKPQLCRISYLSKVFASSPHCSTLYSSHSLFSQTKAARDHPITNGGETKKKKWCVRVSDPPVLSQSPSERNAAHVKIQANLRDKQDRVHSAQEEVRRCRAFGFLKSRRIVQFPQKKLG